MVKFEGVDLFRGKCRIRWSEGKRRPALILDIPYTPTGVKRAYKIRQSIIKQYQAGIIDRGPAPTFGELAQLRLDTTVMAPETKRYTKRNLNKHWLHFFDVPIDQIQYSDLLMPFKSLLLFSKDNQIVPLDPTTVIQILSNGSAVFRLAIKSKWRTDNPALELMREIETTHKPIDPFTKEERDAILRSLKLNQVYQTPYLFYAIRFYCGLRPSEVLALTWADYDHKNSKFLITKSTVRGKHKALLKKTPRQLKDSHILTTKFGNGFTDYTNFSEMFVRAMEREEVRYRSPYNARHTCATMMLEAGMEAVYCAQALGHSPQMFFKTYAKWTNADKSAAQEKIWASIL